MKSFFVAPPSRRLSRGRLARAYEGTMRRYKTQYFIPASRFRPWNAAGLISLQGSFDSVRRLASESTDSAQDDIPSANFSTVYL
jgi:hypothetical protein